MHVNKFIIKKEIIVGHDVFGNAITDWVSIEINGCSFLEAIYCEPKCVKSCEEQDATFKKLVYPWSAMFTPGTIIQFVFTDVFMEDHVISEWRV